MSVAFGPAEPRGADDQRRRQRSQQQHEPDDAELGEHLEVERVPVVDLDRRCRAVRVPGDPVRAGARAVQRRRVEPVQRDAPVVDPPVVDRGGQPRPQVRGVVHVAAFGERRAGIGDPPRRIGGERAEQQRDHEPARQREAQEAPVVLLDLDRFEPPVQRQRRRPQRRGPHGTGEHHEEDVAALVGGGRGGVVVRARQQLVAVGDLHRDRRRDARRRQGRQKPARLCEQDVEHEAERQHPDRAAREGQVERDRDRRQQSRCDDTDDGVFAPTCRQMKGEHGAERAGDAHRVPVGQRERDAFGQEAARDREHVRQQPGEQPRERDRGERRRCPAQQDRQVSDTRCDAPGQDENKAVQQRSIEFRQSARSGVRPGRRRQGPDGQKGKCAGSQCERGTPAFERPGGERDAPDQCQRQHESHQPDLSWEEPTCSKAQPRRRQPR